jgi:tyrosyl-tRNA synthetase
MGWSHLIVRRPLLVANHYLCSLISTAAARQLIQGKGLYFNDKVVPETQFVVTRDDLIDGRVLMLRAGKDKVMVLAITEG